VPGPNLNPKLLRAVDAELSRGNLPAAFGARLARRYKTTARTVRSYVAAVLEKRDEDEGRDRARARQTGRFVTAGASARWMKRADDLYAVATLLLRRAQRIDGDKNGAGAKLLQAIEDATGRPRLDDDPSEPVDPEVAEAMVKRGRALLLVAREDRQEAAMLIKRAEGCEGRAIEWFDRGARIAGIYEAEPPTAPGAGRGAPLTSPQRRAKMETIRTALERRRKAREPAP
jgi:hypothetical protein